MRIKRASLLLSVVLLAAIAIVWYRATNVSDAPILQSDITPSQAQHSPSSAAAGNQATSPAVVEVDEHVNEDFADNFAVVASAYADEINYPPYSIPLRNSDSQLLQPNLYHAQTIPLENGAKASIHLDRFRFTYPEPVNVQLQLEGIQVYEVSLSLFSESTNKLLTTSKMQIDEKGYHTKLSAESDWDGPLRIEIEFKSGGQAQIVQTGFEYSQPVAKIMGVGATSIESTDLIIPVKVKVTVAGHYRLRANLFTADRQPIAVLTASSPLAKGESELKLRAYKAVLKGNSSPLLLNTFQLENRSAAPGEPTRYGDSERPEFVIDYSATELFSEESYKPSEEEKQRLEFLKSMAEKK
ncbi:MAG: hypothetical protein V4732_00755 [Pseudomonadota bacterium]